MYGIEYFPFVLYVSLVTYLELLPRHLLHGGFVHLPSGQNIPGHCLAFVSLHLKNCTKSYMFAFLYPTPITFFISPYQDSAASLFRPIL